MNYLLEALVKKLEGEVEVAKANVIVYTRNSVGIGEHPEVVEAIAQQASTCIHTSCVVHYPANIDLAEKIAEIALYRFL